MKDLPQVLAITRLSSSGSLALNKTVRQHLGMAGAELYLAHGSELILSSTPGSDAHALPLTGARGDRVTLPPIALDDLPLDEDGHVALVERGSGAAIKAFSFTSMPGDWARVADRETPRTVQRIAWRNPLPEEAMAALAADHENLELSAPIWPYISCRRTFAAWEACRLLSGGQGQGEWAAHLRQETLSAQRDDGSWEGELPLTAQRMVELRALGLAESARPLTRAAEWLLAQDESPWCPGMFFLDNALVAEQTSIVRQRQDGGRDRFRKRLSSELSRVRRAAPLCSDPCGPRIMWPNALAIGSLVRCGYATHPRLRRALETMRMHDWCECAYQHGTSDWRRSEPLSEAEIAVFEQACIDEYRSGGVGSNDDLRRGDASRPTERARMPRVAATQRQGHVEYALRTPNHLQGCELETTRALASVDDPLLRRFAEAHLWRFAGRQRGPDAGDAMGTFGDAWRYYTEPTVAVLSVFAQYDHPASRVAIHRALAWLASHQNSDGSWGKDEYAEEATLAVVQCLLRIREELPQGIAQALGTQSIRGYDGAC